ncbi:MAG: hypothetical protein WD651_09690 [Acidimicrobiia bacterium]
MTIHVTEQQLELLERLVEVGDHGDDLAVVLMSLFRSYAARFLGVEHSPPGMRT